MLDGVMMRSRKGLAVAVRHPAGHLVVREESVIPGRLARIFRLVPVLRGAASMWDILVLGMRALAFSAAVSVEDRVPIEPSRQGEQESDRDRAGSHEDGFIWATLTVGMILGVGLFFVVPVLITRLIDPQLESDLVSNLVEGLIRLALLLAYLLVIGLLPDIRRTFEYHGAEHKTVNAMEAGEELTIANVMRHSSAHPRCGTNFLLVVVLLSILVFAMLGRPDLPLRIGSRIVLVPLIAGVGFEFIRFLAVRRSNVIAGWILRPGLWIQALTTRPPMPDQVEVAILAMTRLLRSEGVSDGPISSQTDFELRS